MVDTATKIRRVFVATPKAAYAILLIVLCILFADLNARPRTFNSPETRILERIFINANQDPINAIQLLPPVDSVCPEGFTSITFGSWPGTVQGCQCGDRVFPGVCTQSGCTNIPAVSAQHITKWKGDQFCIKRVPFTYPVNNSCEGSQRCASGVCVANAEACPITDIQIRPSTFVAPADYTSITLSGDRVLVYTDKEGNSPVTDLRVSLYDFPCMDPLTMPYSTKRTPYPLSVLLENGCDGSGMADNLENIENQPLPTVFAENNLISVASLPGFQEFISQEKAYLIGLQQYQIASPDSRCWPVDPVRFAEVQKDEHQFVRRVWPLLIAVLVVMCIKFITILIELILRLRKNEEEDHWLNLFAGVNILLLLGACVLFIIVGAHGVNAEIRLGPNTRFFKFLAYNQCFSQTVVNRVFQVFQGNISNFYAIVWLSITLLIISGATIIVVTILGLVNNLYGKKDNIQSYYRSVKRIAKKPLKGSKTPAQSGNIEMLLAR